MKGMIYMAFSSHRKQFKGQLANISVSMLNELNYDIELLADRKGYIEEKYKRVKPFYDLFINGDESIEYYKVGLNKDDDLSAEINIFKTIERDGSYLLNSRDVPRDRNQEYTFLTEGEFKIIEKISENSIAHIQQLELLTSIIRNDRSIYFFIKQIETPQKKRKRRN